MHPEVLLAGGYAVVLLASGALLEWLARHTAVRAQRFRAAGFTYHPQHDLWVCPENEPLWPYEVDRQHRVVRYRARSTVCNACPAKSDCTDSRTGRELVRAVDPWPHSEAGRFHRAISVALAVFAAAFLVAAAVAYHRPAELLLEAGMLAVTVAVGVRWGVDLIRTPTGFPEVNVSRSQVSAGERATAGGSRPSGPTAPVLIDLVPPSRRSGGTVWDFDGRRTGTRDRWGRTGADRATEEDG
ncbi:MAG TPA: hypothetical protein VF462_05255 [Micromonosporaceae bacterium]